MCSPGGGQTTSRVLDAWSSEARVLLFILELIYNIGIKEIDMDKLIELGIVCLGALFVYGVTSFVYYIVNRGK